VRKDLVAIQSEQGQIVRNKSTVDADGDKSANASYAKMSGIARSPEKKSVTLGSIAVDQWSGASLCIDHADVFCDPHFVTSDITVSWDFICFYSYLSSLRACENSGPLRQCRFLVGCLFFSLVLNSGLTIRTLLSLSVSLRGVGAG